jgi:pimeloyl-ACP methyl ester carboxylesterase
VLALGRAHSRANGPDRARRDWERQLTGVADQRIVVVPDARHFVMLDAPDFVYGVIERALVSDQPGSPQRTPMDPVRT